MAVSDVLAELVWAIDDSKEFNPTTLTDTSKDLDEYLSWPPEIGYTGDIREEIINLKVKMDESSSLDKLQEIRNEAERLRIELDKPPARTEVTT